MFFGSFASNFFATGWQNSSKEIMFFDGNVQCHIYTSMSNSLKKADKTLEIYFICIIIMCKQTKIFCIKIFDSQQSTRRKSKFTIMRTIQLFAVIFCITSSFGAEILGLNEVIKTKENTKIVGGETIEMEEAPFVALLMFKRLPHCGASILSTTCLLTASVSFTTNYLIAKLTLDII